MKNKLKKFFINAKVFIKKNALSCLCLLLATLVAVTGSVSYSKYISSSPITEGPGAGSFSASATIDSISALSFTNTAFWGGTVEDDRIAMNALRSVNFSVKNYKEDSSGNKKVADVKLKYSLVFSAPVNFSERLALQVFDQLDNPMLPQVVIADLLSFPENEKDDTQHTRTYNTFDSEDYNASPISDLTFNVNLTTTPINGKQEPKYCKAVASTASGDVIIQLERFDREVHQSLLFRMWDTSALTSPSSPTLETEGGKLLPPLTVNYKKMVTFYRISITMPEFVLPAGVESTVLHSIQLAPTNTIQDLHLGGTFVENVGGSYVPVKEIYGPDSEADEKNWTLQTVHEVQTDDYFGSYNSSTQEFSNPIMVDGNQKHDLLEYNIMGSPKIYDESDEEKVSLPVIYPPVVVDDKTPIDWSTVPAAYWDEISTLIDAPDIDDCNDVKDNAPSTPTTSPAGTGWRWNTNNSNEFFASSTTEKVNVGTYWWDSREKDVYIYKIPYTSIVEREGTIVEETINPVSAGKETTTNTSYTDSEKVIKVTAGQQNITIRIERTTTTKVVEVPYTQTAIRTTSIKVTYTVKGYRYFACYNPANSNTQVPTNNSYQIYEGFGNQVTVGGKTYNLITNLNNPNTDIEWDFGSMTASEPVRGDVVNVEEGELIAGEQEEKSTEYSTEYIRRQIDRSFNHDNIIIETVTWPERDAAGNPLYDANDNPITTAYTNTSKLNLYKTESGVDVQKLYLSQCYSKNYPFYVNVVFEQYLN